MNNAANSASESFASLLESGKGTPVIITDRTRFIEGTYCGNGFVSYGGKSDAVIDSSELKSLELERDQKYTFMVVAIEGDIDDGEVVLSYMKARVWEQAVETAKTGGCMKIVTHRIARRRHDKQICGMDVLLLGSDGRPALKAFIPRSELTSERMRNEELEKLVFSLGHSTEVMEAKVVSAKPNENVILSLAKAQREQKLDSAQVGNIYAARVLSIQPYGALVDIGGASGLVHISEMPNRNVNSVKVGDQVEVTVIDIDRERGRIEFSLTAKRKHDLFASLKVGMELDGVCRHNADPGSFIVLDGDAGVDGLLPHRGYGSQGQPKVGDKVRVRIFNIDHDRGRIGLTMRGVASGSSN